MSPDDQVTAVEGYRAKGRRKDSRGSSLWKDFPVLYSSP